MSGGLVALLDDIAAIAKLAAASIDDVGAAAGKASAKAVGVVVDDTAVTPRYVQGFSADRELPIIKRIAFGSLRNKLLLILPVAMLLSQFAPWVMPFILIAGGAFLSFEGAEKIVEALTGGHHTDPAEHPAATGSPEYEKTMVSGAIRTDLILSAEIMVISLASVATEPFLTRLAVMIVVAFGITILVYGVVAMIVKMDDIGLALATKHSGATAAFGRGLVKAMPKVMWLLSVVGVAAMLWVGGHILLVNVAEVGWHWPLDQVHRLEEPIKAIAGAGAFLAWLVETVISAIIGLILGGLIVGVVHVIPKPRKKSAAH